MADLCLGTVQFGMNYGINNNLGQPSKEDCFSMIDLALENQINVIDTAGAYGQAEEILGEYFKARKNAKTFKIISKLKPNILEPDMNAEKIVERELKNSLRTMGIDHLDGYLLHTPEYIYREDVLEALDKVKKAGLTDNVGISIYDIKEGFAAIQSGLIDYIQVPYSILDQRAIKTGFAEKAKAAGVTLFARSAFLQGLYMMKEEQIPENLKEVIPYVHILQNLIEKYNINKIDALIYFVICEKNIDYLVFGVETKEQLSEDIKSYKNGYIPYEFVQEIKNYFKEVDKSIIFPSLWSNGKKVK